jgi:hydrogenase nickel incorporation protein HypA/HybF
MHELSIVASLFEILEAKARETIAAEARLEIEEVQLKMRCRKCAAEIEKEDFVLVCPSCGATDLEILEGMELLLDKIDLEV